MKHFTSIRTKDGQCEAWEISPDKEGKFPAVLMYMDAIGIRPALLHLAQRIADRGFIVLLPNLFYRHKSLPIYDYPEKFEKEELNEKFFPLITPWKDALTHKLLIEDAEFYLKHLLTHPKVSGTKAGIVGYCFGVGHAIRSAATYPQKVGVVVGLHGGKLLTDEQTSPHSYLKFVQAKMYFGHADHDQSMPGPMIEKFEKALKEHALDFESEILIGAHHGYSQEDLPAFDTDASEKTFNKTIDLMKTLR